MIHENIEYYSVRMMCKMLRVSPSGYYDWCNRSPSAREKENIILARKIKSIFDEEHSRVGAKRISKILKLHGVLVGRHRLQG